jgi:hypothetical protein
MKQTETSQDVKDFKDFEKASSVKNFSTPSCPPVSSTIATQIDFGP